MNITAYKHISHQKMLWILICQAAVIAPHILRIPIWISLLCFSAGCWGYYAVAGKWKYPGKLLLLTIVTLSCLAVAYQYKTIIGQEAGVSLLMIMMSLKLLEIKKQSDVILFIFLGYFLVITNFLETQTMAMAAYMLIVSVALTSTLVMLARHGPQTHLKANIKIASTLIIQAFPLMLVLFILFPRLPGPLWMLPEDSKHAISGLSDSMSPGMISQLSRSDAVAFRVTFKDKPLKQSELYWRGPVLSYYDDKTWKTANKNAFRKNNVLQVSGQATNYTITMEPHYQNWLFALDIAANKPDNSFINHEHSLLSTKSIDDVYQYTIDSYTDYEIDANMPAHILRKYMHIADKNNPRTRAWANQINNKNMDSKSKVQLLLNHFRVNNFIYSLTPPLLGNNNIDDFLFKTQNGFCEHYASSFTYLMRLLKVPARVVVGYQGGEYNEVGNYMIVRQSDAHAWAEVWLHDKGWIRIDPTSAVAPERVESGISGALPGRESNTGLIRSNNPLFRSMLLYWDSVNYKWHSWVLGYDAKTQNKFLDLIGINSSNWEEIAVSILISIGTIIIIISLWINLNKRKIHRDSVCHLYDKFCSRLAKIGLTREPYEGPIDFSRRAICKRQDLKQDIQLITQFYIQLRYQRDPPGSLFKQFQNRVRSFKPRKNNPVEHTA